MKQQIVVYYFKNKKQPHDYIVKRVINHVGINYSISSYYMVKGKIKEYPSKLLISDYKLNQYLLQCMKSECFDHIEYQNLMEGI